MTSPTRRTRRAQPAASNTAAHLGASVSCRTWYDDGNDDDGNDDDGNDGNDDDDTH